MRDYQIVTDSTADLAVSVLEKIDVTVIPMEFHIDGKSYHNYPDEREYNMQEFYAGLKAGKTSTTSQINQQTFLEVFEPILREGKDVLYLGFSSGLSGTYQSSLLAAEELRGRYPEAKVVCVDTLAASGGEGLLVYTPAPLPLVYRRRPLPSQAGRTGEPDRRRHRHRLGDQAGHARRQ